MGFYNYFRLLKELRFLFRNKFVKKILTILIITILIISILHVNGYCATDYNIYPPYHGQSSMVELIINDQITAFDFWFDYNTMTLQKETHYDITGNYFYLVPGWDYYIVNNSGITFNYLILNDIPAVGTKFSTPFFGLTEQTYYPITPRCWLYWYW